MQNNNKRADCGSPNSLVGAAETAAPPDKKSLASEELARLLKWRFKMDLNQRPPD